MPCPRMPSDPSASNASRVQRLHQIGPYRCNKHGSYSKHNLNAAIAIPSTDCFSLLWPSCMKHFKALRSHIAMSRTTAFIARTVSLVKNHDFWHTLSKDSLSPFFPVVYIGIYHGIFQHFSYFSMAMFGGVNRCKPSIFFGMVSSSAFRVSVNLAARILGREDIVRISGQEFQIYSPEDSTEHTFKV